VSAATRLTTCYVKRMEPGRRFIHIKEVRQRTRLGNATIYKRMNEGTFPPNVALRPQMSAWVESEVDAWISSQAANKL
jgi:prophage regulatory protein